MDNPQTRADTNMMPSTDEPQARTVYDLLTVQAAAHPDRPALSAPDRPDLTYTELLTLIEATAEALHHAGLGRGKRISIVLDNGPEMAASFLAVASTAGAAPLNPGYRYEEFSFYLKDAAVDALIVAADSESPAVRAAADLNIPILRLTTHTDQSAGHFTLDTHTAPDAPEHEYALAEDIALLLHTSGTTSRPKLVPLRQRNILSSAYSISRSLALTSEDRCLNIMPLFHVHGLMGALLSSMVAGAQVFCTPGFYAPSFFGWMDACAPTWYTAVPTMHQSILQRADQNRSIIDRHPLRFVRSSSASLAPNVMRALEETFQTPALEAYGMTEASHQMSINPLPPGKRKPGSVGLASGPEIAIMDDEGNLLPDNQSGAIVIRGPGVIDGYENNPQANAEAFTDGWFRTGDEGRLDEDGYLYITGRSKEIINRGGEKISPREVDEVLLSHADIRQAVAFAVPDTRLGEDVGVAVILADQAALTERDIRDFAAQRLTDFKVPRHVLIVDEIPMGPTGKLQRIGLAEKLGLTTAYDPTDTGTPYAPPRTDTERVLAEIWQEVLGVDQPGIRDHFLDLGGDSMLATHIVTRIRLHLNVDVTIRDFFDAPTIADMAEIIEEIAR